LGKTGIRKISATISGTIAAQIKANQFVFGAKCLEAKPIPKCAKSGIYAYSNVKQIKFFEKKMILKK
jgi:hypothetical protein